MTSKLIIALDFPNAQQALAFVKPLTPNSCKLKVGFELFVAAGPDFVKCLVGQGFDIFLDLKFHDIPNTVAAACRRSANLGVWMMNVHAFGGKKMLLAAVEALKEQDDAPLLIAVSVLTSMNNASLLDVGVNQTTEEQVLKLSMMSKTCGLDGMVCSAQEAALLRQNLGSEFLLVTPGIRPKGANQGDQSRIMTPELAVMAGSSYLVIGRPVTQANDPLQLIEQINMSLNTLHF
jgi:orotidine-5'-phosphate decarboxylase